MKVDIKDFFKSLKSLRKAELRKRLQKLTGTDINQSKIDLRYVGKYRFIIKLVTGSILRSYQDLCDCEGKNGYNHYIEKCVKT